MLVPGNLDQTPDESSRAESGRGPDAPPRVLVVDDEEVNRQILAHMLQKQGYVPTAVSSGRQALELLAHHPFDVVLLDVVMPEMDGFECLRLIRQTHPVGELPIIMVTAEADRDRVVTAFRQGANDYVTKPIDREITLARMATHTQLRQTLKALRESEERYALAARGANDGLWDWNVAYDHVYYSPRWKSMLGYRETEVGTSPDEWLSRIHPDDLAKFQQTIVDKRDSHQTHLECEVRMLHRDGTYRWMLCRGVNLRDETGRLFRMAGSLTDITEGKVGDPLTGLPNRLLFVDRLERAIERARRTRSGYFAILFLDIDNFKLINDSMGHQAGDKLLITLANRLEQCLRSVDTVARLGRSSTVARHAGDEFTVLLEEVRDPSFVEMVAERILASLSEPAAVESLEVFPTVSIGWAVGNHETRSTEDLLREADTAMYHAKSEGRNRHRQFEPGMQHRATARLEMEKDIRRSLQDDEFFLEYQPIVDLPSGRLTSVETLVRWQHPTRGLLMPSEFIETAEEIGLIVPLGWWIIERTFEHLRQWRKSFGPGRPQMVSVNCSVRQLYQADFLKQFELVMERTGADARQICVEVTESTLMDKPDQARRVLSGLREMGVQIGIDDFGTGYSSLAYLHRFPLDMLKIDRSFVGTMFQSEESFEIVRTIIDLGRSLKLKLVAEGVETPEQRDSLVSLGCTHAQGHLWSRPVSGLMVDRYLQREQQGGSPTAWPATSLVPYSSPGWPSASTLNEPPLTFDQSAASTS